MGIAIAVGSCSMIMAVTLFFLGLDGWGILSAIGVFFLLSMILVVITANTVDRFHNHEKSKQHKTAIIL